MPSGDNNVMNSYKLVSFDLDGTLLRTALAYRLRTVGKTLESLGVAYYSIEDVDLFWFRGNRDRVIAERFGLEPEVFWKRFREYDGDISLRMKFTEPYEDVAFVKELRQRGYRTVIVTGSPEHIANMEVEILGRGNFDAVIVANDTAGRKPKPHPSPLEGCMEKPGMLNGQTPP